MDAPVLTRRATELLHAMIAAEDRGEHEEAEIVCSGIECWLDTTQVSRRTVDNLLRHMAVRTLSEPGELERFAPSGTGRRIAADPAVADRVLAAVLTGGAFDDAGNPLAMPGDEDVETANP